MLLFRERQGLVSVVNVTLQCVLERSTGYVTLDAVTSALRVCYSDLDPGPALREIANVVNETIDEIRGRHSRSVSATASVKVQSPTPLANLPVDRIHDSVLAEILKYLAPAHDSVGSFRHLVAATHVCTRWRKVALRVPRLWSQVIRPCIGELRALPHLLRRSATHPLRVEIHFADASADVRDLVLSTLTDQMYRLETLALVLDSDFQDGQDRALFAARAPILRELDVCSAKQLVIPHDLFRGVAPCLRKLTVDVIGRLPHLCPALSNLEDMVFRNPPETVSIADVKRLRALCPILSGLSLHSALRGAHGGTPSADPDLRGLRRLGLNEHLRDTQSNILLVPTLRLFDFTNIGTIHMRRPSPGTASFLAKDLARPSSLFFLRAADPDSLVILRDAHGRRRVLSQLMLDGMDQQLRRAWQSAPQLADLGIWEYIALADLTALLAVPLPLLRTLTIFVGGSGLAALVPPAALHVFDAAARTPGALHCPALQTLCFTSRAPELGLFPPAARCPALSAAEIGAFVGRAIQPAPGRRIALVMNGVRFVERFDSANVAALRQQFADIVLQPLSA